MADQMRFDPGSRPIITVFNDIKNVTKKNGIDLQPPYQRGFIWSQEFIDKLIFSIIKSWPIGNISLRILSEKNSKDATQEVVDGQQRLTAIRNFMNDAHGVQGDNARKIIEYICDYMGEDDDKKLAVLKRKLGNKGKIIIKFSQLPEIIQRNIEAFPLSISSISNASDEEIAEYFKFLQNQERLRAGELINSLPNSALEKHLDKINDKDKLLRVLGFPNDRRQFDRAFYSVLGLLDNKLNFGALDKDVIKYVTDSTCLEPKANEQCVLLLTQLNHITSISLAHNLIKANVRFMKFFLLTAALGVVDYLDDAEKKLVALDSINKKLSAFTSAKAKEVERVFNGYSEEVKEEHRLLALIAKGGNTLKRAENRAQILAYYINDFQNKTVPSGIVPV
jgi:hypothetical protein